MSGENSCILGDCNKHASWRPEWGVNIYFMCCPDIPQDHLQTNIWFIITFLRYPKHFSKKCFSRRLSRKNFPFNQHHYLFFSHLVAHFRRGLKKQTLATKYVGNIEEEFEISSEIISTLRPPISAIRLVSHMSEMSIERSFRWHVLLNTNLLTPLL